MGVEMCSSLAKIGAGCSTAFLTKSFHQIAQLTPWTPFYPPPLTLGVRYGGQNQLSTFSPLRTTPMTNFTSLKMVLPASSKLKKEFFSNI